MSKLSLVKIFGFVFGIICLVMVFKDIGIARMLGQVFALGWWSLPLLVNSFVWVLFYAEAWRSYFAHLKKSIHFASLVRIRLCSDAVNLITPLNFFLGDPVRFYLMERMVGSTTRMGSILVDRVVHSWASVFFVWLGIGITFVTPFNWPPVLQWGLFLFYLALNILLALFLHLLLRGKVSSLLLPFFHRFAFVTSRMANVEAQLVLLEEEFLSFGHFLSRPLMVSFFCHWMGRVLGAFEIMIIFYYLKGEPLILLSTVLASLTTVIHLVFSFVPGGVGIVEALYAGFFSYYQMGKEEGIAMQLIRRLRAFLWIVIGLVVLQLSKKFPSKERHQKKA